MTKDQIEKMVDRFLAWKLPEDFTPDAGISFKAEFNEHTTHPMKHKPVGTNLFSADQARAMVSYMLEGLPLIAATPSVEGDYEGDRNHLVQLLASRDDFLVSRGLFAEYADTLPNKGSSPSPSHTAGVKPRMMDLEALEKVARAATPGPWRLDGDFLRTDDPVEVDYERTAIADTRYFHLPKDRQNAAHIAAFDPPTVLALIAQARRAELPWVEWPGPGTCEGDDSAHVLAFLNVLHEHLPEDERPTAWMQFSDDQRERIQRAYRAMVLAAPEPPADDAVRGLVETRGVYVASRASVLERGQMWRAHRAAGAPIISTWIDEDGENDTADLDELWVRIRREVTTANLLILYVEPDDFPLKGAFVEVGMALAASVPIAIVAPGVEIGGRNCRPFGSWIKHPSVSFAATVDKALAAHSRLAGLQPGGEG